MRIMISATVIACLAASRPASAQPAAEASAGVAIPVATYLDHRGAEFENGTGVAGHVGFLLGDFSFTYDYATLSNQQVCAADCYEMGDMGSTTVHAAGIGYRLFFTQSAIRPFVSLGMAGITASLGNWPMAAADDRVWGGEAIGGGGVRIELGRMFVTVDTRYRYLLTNDPLRNEQEDTIYTVFLDTPATEKQYVQDAHVIDVQAGVGSRF